MGFTGFKITACKPHGINKGVFMKEETVFYQGRHVSKKGFRAFVYGASGDKALANSWDEFEAKISSGLWHAEEQEALKAPLVTKKDLKTKREGIANVHSKTIRKSDIQVDIPREPDSTAS